MGNIPSMVSAKPDWKTRIRAAIQKDGRPLKTLSLLTGAGETFVRDLLERDKAPSIDKMIALCGVLGISITEIMSGESALTGTSVRVMGYIGAGSEIEPDFEQVPDDGLETIELPFPIPDDTIAFRIAGPSMLPKYGDGDVIVVWTQQRRPLEAYYGEEAAVRTDDGRRFLKRIARGARKTVVNLESFNARTIEGVKLAWIGEICATVPQGQIRRIDQAARAAQAKKAKQRAMARTAQLPLSGHKK